MWDYTDKVKDYFYNPKNSGILEDASGVGDVGAISCGDALRRALQLCHEIEARQGRIEARLQLHVAIDDPERGERRPVVVCQHGLEGLPEHCLTEDQIAVYDAYAEAWAIIHANLRDALEATRIVDQDSGDTLNSGAKAAALSIFEGTKQRFFAQLLLSMKLPSLLPAIEAALAEGNTVVVQLVSTAEAMLAKVRAIAERAV